MANNSLVVAPVGDALDALFIGIKEFPTQEVILICPSEYNKQALEAKKSLEKFNIPVKIIDIKGNIWEEMFREISKIARTENNREVIINVATGDRSTQCAATSAAFVNGLKAFSIMGKSVMLLPVLKFSYYKLLTERKLAIIKLISKGDCCASLEELSKKTKMSLPLVSYHVNGNLKSEGLKQLGLVETQEKSGRISVTLTLLGKMLVKGYIS